MDLLRTWRFWGRCLAGWTMLALVETATTHFDALHAGRVSHPGAILADRALADLVWLGVAAIVFVTMERAMARAPSGGRIAIRFALLGALLAPIYVTWGPVSHTLVRGGGWPGLPAALGRISVTLAIWDAFLYLVITLSASMTLLSRRSRGQEADRIALRARLAQAELELLRAQLEPHFLFNALNTIAGLVRSGRTEPATTALAKLSELLRYVTDATQRDLVPLAWEVEFVTNYLELQQMRFGSRLRFAIHEDIACRGCDVPPLLLQPLIENAVVHGVARTSDPVSIEVTVAAAQRELRVEICNTRDADAGAWTSGSGLGLNNTRLRLERMYGREFAFQAGPDGADRYRVTISLPRSVDYA